MAMDLYLRSVVLLGSHALVLVRPRAPVTCWLSDEGHSPQSETGTLQLHSMLHGSF